MNIRTSLEANRKRGKHRDVQLLTDILRDLFWARNSPYRSINDILSRLGYNLKYDTLEDNLVFLSNTGDPTFLKLSKERDGDRIGEIVVYHDLLANIDRGKACLLRSTGGSGRPRNLYSLDDYYIENYFSKSCELEVNIKAAIRCRDGHTDPAKCNPMTCPRKDCRKHMEYLER